MSRITRSLALAAAAAAALAARAMPAHAEPYEVFIDVENEDDLDDLAATGQISEETHDALRELLDRGVDLDRASRDDLYALPNLTYADVDAILQYRKLQGFIRDPADLVSAGAITSEKLLAISAFLVIEDHERSPYQPRGWVRVLTRAARGQNGWTPPVALRARATSGKYLTAGLAVVVERRGIGAPVWDPNRDALLADAPAVRAALPKAFVRYKGDDIDVIAGTYRIGFGQRLTFDTALDPTPNGIYIDDQIQRSYDMVRDCIESTGELLDTPCYATKGMPVPGDPRYDYTTPDFNWSEGLRGIAAGTEHIPLGEGHLQLYGWGSYQNRSLYQYELVDRGACSDPRDDADPACAAPSLYTRPSGDLLTPVPSLSYQTLPSMFGESLIGANVAYYASRRDYVGITGYGATIDWLPQTPPGVQLDFQEWSRWPTGGRHGAIGAALGLGLGFYDLGAEITQSFDRIPAGDGPIHGGGGPAAVVRGAYTRKKRMIEVIGRYYDPDFVNPYAGSVAESDEVEGQRARGEHGVRVKYTDVLGSVGLRAGLDIWRGLVPVMTSATQSDWTYEPRIDVYVRTQITASERVRWGVWLRYQDRGLGDTNPMPCYEVLYFDGEVGEPVTCLGNKLTTTGTLRLDLGRRGRGSVTALAQHELLDDPHDAPDKRQDITAQIVGLWKPSERLRLRARVRYLNEDISDNAYLETSLRTYAEATFGLRKKDRLALRGDLIFWLDKRESTVARTPSPEAWLTADYQAFF